MYLSVWRVDTFESISEEKVQLVFVEGRIVPPDYYVSKGDPISCTYNDAGEWRASSDNVSKKCGEPVVYIHGFPMKPARY